MKPGEILAELVRDWHGSIRRPALARCVLFARSMWADEFYRAFVQAMLCNDGNWRFAFQDLQRAGVWPSARLAGLKRWAEKVTASPVRGLLEWKGGAL